MNTKNEPRHQRALDPHVDLRTIPAGWDLSGFYGPASDWVNDAQQSFEAPQHPNRETQTHNDEPTDTV